VASIEKQHGREKKAAKGWPSTCEVGSPYPPRQVPDGGKVHLRGEKGPVRAVAATLRWAQSYVSKCGSGERRVDVVELAQFAQLYRKDLSYFVS